jgi:acrylyl-CoA reductase (NADPH)
MPDTANPRAFPAFVVRRQDDQLSSGVEEWRLEDLPPGEVVVDVAWSSVNYKDAMVTVPGNRVTRLSPLVPGIDLAGTVAASDDTAIAPGTAVLVHGGDVGVARHGGFAGRARVRADTVVVLPDGLSPRDAMTIGTAGFTAALSLDQLERYGLRPEQGPVLVTGASGGVGSFAVALLAARGYEVVASTGKTDEHGWLRNLGASSVIGRDEVDEAAGRVLGPEHWAGAVDCVGGTTLAMILQSLRYGAAVAASGLTGGTDLQTTVFPFITRSVSLLGVDSVRTPMPTRRAIWSRLAGDLRPKRLDDFVAGEVTLEALPAALADILAARVRGRLLVRPGTPG